MENKLEVDEGLTDEKVGRKQAQQLGTAHK